MHYLLSENFLLFAHGRSRWVGRRVYSYASVPQSLSQSFGVLWQDCFQSLRAALDFEISHFPSPLMDPPPCTYRKNVHALPCGLGPFQYLFALLRLKESNKEPPSIDIEAPYVLNVLFPDCSSRHF